MLPMRPLLAALILGALLGGLKLYMAVRPSREVSAPPKLLPTAAGRFAIDVTLSFAAGPDPYALESDNAPSLLVLFRGQEIIRETTILEPGAIVRRDDLGSVAVGANEFFLRATPQDSNSLARARFDCVSIAMDIRSPNKPFGPNRVARSRAPLSSTFLRKPAPRPSQRPRRNRATHDEARSASWTAPENVGGQSAGD